MAGTYFESQREGDRLDLKLAGEWRAPGIAAIRQAQQRLDMAGVKQVRFDVAAADMDLAGTWLLNNIIRQFDAASIGVEFIGAEPRGLHVVREALEMESQARPPAMRTYQQSDPVERLGRTVVERLREARVGLSFVGSIVVSQLRALTSLRRLRLTSIARHVYDTGVTAIPIVSLIAFLISVIIAYLSASQLREYGADVYVVDLITVGVLRELGVLLTAIIVAGRTGSVAAIAR